MKLAYIVSKSMENNQQIQPSRKIGAPDEGGKTKDNSTKRIENALSPQERAVIKTKSGRRVCFSDHLQIERK